MVKEIKRAAGQLTANSKRLRQAQNQSERYRGERGGYGHLLPRQDRGAVGMERSGIYLALVG